ncbi:FixH family protein [Paenibacillus alkaliterrae]|uniref:FixH family protein n=1 Tax=Paenibacillus alkaliterrae TaxID=320909 RepID=UPI001F410E86|nr:FixH family protein [Paenibacillus alkaliterrae]MCF2937109.1 FixH family protein [Paenibacillus alkaliterrae]
MLPQNKPLAPRIKLALAIIILGMAIAFLLTWLFSGKETAPQITEHAFESGNLIWSIEGYPAKALHENTFSLHVTNLNGAPFEGADLAIKLDMLGMVCGDVEFQMTEAAPGKYTGEGIPLMPGMWKATLTLEAGNQTYTLERRLEAVH